MYFLFQADFYACKQILKYFCWSWKYNFVV